MDLRGALETVEHGFVKLYPFGNVPNRFGQKVGREQTALARDISVQRENKSPSIRDGHPFSNTLI